MTTTAYLRKPEEKDGGLRSSYQGQVLEQRMRSDSSVTTLSGGDGNIARVSVSLEHAADQESATTCDVSFMCPRIRVLW